MRASAPPLWVALVLVAACASSKHIRKTEEDGERLRLDLAETYVQKRAYAAAIPLLRRLVVEHPDDAHVHVLYGTVLREQGLYPQADKELSQATRLAPGSGEAWASLGVLYDLMRRPADAEAAHRKAIALQPGHASFWNNLGFSLYVAGQTDAAIEALEKALALDPALTVSYNNLGFAYGRRGDLVDAERSFRTAGGPTAALLNMAIVHDQRGDEVSAARLRAEAQARDPKLNLEHLEAP
jgi:Flp pilus assembly protein TadD